MGTGLLADEAQLTHQTSNPKTANHHTLLTHHAHDAAAARRSSAVTEKLVDLATQGYTTSIGSMAADAIVVVARAGYIES
ncbi:hypothetical protein D3C78_1719430 [compost metagenome]